MANVTIQLHGFEELEKRLSGMPKKIENKCFRQALRRTANTIKPRIQSGTPSATGEAKSSVKVKTKVRRGGAYAVIKYTNRPQLYMRIFEQGGKRQPARPFFESAVGNYEGEVNSTFLTELKAAVERNEG